MILTGVLPVVLFLSSQVSAEVTRILTLAGGVGGLTALLKFILDWRAQAANQETSAEERTERLRRRVSELEDAMHLKDDQIAALRRQVRDAEVLIEAQASQIAVDARKFAVQQEEIQWLRSRFNLYGGPTDGS